MGLLTEKVTLKLQPAYINHFGKLGYNMPLIDYGNGEFHVDKSQTIEIDVNDLPEGSGVDVLVQCDNPNCKDIHKVRYYNYIKMMKKYNAVYCRECVIKLFHSGENAPNWSGRDIDQDYIKRRDNSMYRAFKKAVLERDKYTCQCCGSTEDFEVHHKNGYSTYIEQRYDVDNGITLCHSCHCDFHNKYGRGNNTVDQYDEWLNNVNLQEISHIERYSNKKHSKKVYCYEESKIYESIDDFKSEKNLNKHDSSISKVCNHTLKDARGFHIFWLDEYVNLTDSEIQSYISN